MCTVALLEGWSRLLAEGCKCDRQCFQLLTSNWLSHTASGARSDTIYVLLAKPAVLQVVLNAGNTHGKCLVATLCERSCASVACVFLHCCVILSATADNRQ